ncbi:HAT transposon superfamily protein [Actinidia rufa]|uniref:HAT transposon superfamily protein n=1 Tax=Actinidia rufa TaxID=165716 RepID=A0A7J0EWC1_9ERIC|nr:HAT transposon superfamily protein [Actinidia rufa]
MVETQDFFDALAASQQKDDQGLAPPRATDPGWAHGVMVNGGRQKIKCKYCHKVILGGGISRLKQHLAGERGNVVPCDVVPEDVKVQFQQHLGFKVLEKMKRKKGLKSEKNSSIYLDNCKGDKTMQKKTPKVASRRDSTGERRGKEVDEGMSNRAKKRKKHFNPVVTPDSHPPILSLASQESIDQADMTVAKFMFDGGIPLSASKSYYFQQMADAIAAAGPGYKMPSYHSLRGKLLNKSVQESKEQCRELRKSCKDIGKMDQAKEVLAKAKQITRFIYNNSWVLDLMRKRTGGQDIIQLAITRYASHFLTLQNIVSLKEPLHQMFNSDTWTQSTFSKQRAGLVVAEIMMDQHFWSLCDQTLKAAKPLLTVLDLIDCDDRPSVGYIYDAMETAKESIIVAFNNEESDYLPYLNVIDRIWQEELQSPLHAAGYYLNPSIFYNPSFSINKVVQKGLLDCIETLEPNLTAQVTITSHINFYKDAVGDFGRPMALRGRETLAPATWWSLYASDYADLQRFAVRDLTREKEKERENLENSTIVNRWILKLFDFHFLFSRQILDPSTTLAYHSCHPTILATFELGLSSMQSRQEVSKTMITDEYDPICLEAIDANTVDWVQDPESVEGDDCGWMDLAVPSERMVVSPKPQSIDACDDSTYDRCSDDHKGIDMNKEM